MLINEQTIEKAVQAQVPVFYFYSTEEFLVRRAARHVLQCLSQVQEETTLLEGPAPSIEEIVMAAGTISFFGTRRVVELPLLQPASYSDKDLDALCDVLESAENAVFVITSSFEDERAMAGKRAKRFAEQCAKLGYAAQLHRPQPQDLRRMLEQRAAELGTQLPDTVAAALLERCGQDMFALQNEVDKLAALSGYTQITPAMVAQLGTQDLEADVFEMVRFITAKNSTRACEKLDALLRLQNDPIAITAALIGSYIDLYRVKAGQAVKKNYSAVFKDFGYKGKDYRLKKSAETAQRYTASQLAMCLDVLQQTDQALKSSPVDKAVLLQAALCQLASIGVAR